eukprot:TRINITY_DN2050_c0_g1_i1.p1 TRINITY_DN2050_c0_g1~~TRINITY_DN2050_c0_g1_i1.p1  ORF type:complete len:435 (-),score=115.51 TRINITY_DN2050_c0_g1_i1:111-1394(-)
MSFSELWDGFFKVTGHMKTGRMTMKDVVAFLTERAEIETRYAASIKVLCDKHRSETEKGTIGDAWKALKSQTESLGKQREQMAIQFSRDIATPMNTLLSTHKKLKDQYVEEHDKAHKKMEKARAENEAAKKKYFKLCKELELAEADAAKPKPDQKHQQQADAKAKKARVDMEKADAEYRKAVEAAAAAEDGFNQTTARLLDLFETMEKERYDQMLALLTIFIQTQEGGLTAAQQSFNVMQSSVGKISKSDISAFIDATRTGQPLPNLTIYTSYFDGAAGTPGPAAGPAVQAKVVFEYTATDTSELSLVVGDTVTDIQKDGSGWWTGTVGGKRGLFPANYVEEIAPAPAPASPLSSRAPSAAALPPRAAGPSGKKYKVLFDYNAEGEDELSIKTGETVTVEEENEGWYIGTNSSGKKGMFPSNYVTPA